MSPLISVRCQLPSTKARILHENKIEERFVKGIRKRFVIREVGKTVTDFYGLKRYRIAHDGSLREIV